MRALSPAVRLWCVLLFLCSVSVNGQTCQTAFSCGGCLESLGCYWSYRDDVRSGLCGSSCVSAAQCTTDRRACADVTSSTPALPTTRPTCNSLTSCETCAQEGCSWNTQGGLYCSDRCGSPDAASCTLTALQCPVACTSDLDCRSGNFCQVTSAMCKPFSRELEACDQVRDIRCQVGYECSSGRCLLSRDVSLPEPARCPAELNCLECVKTQGCWWNERGCSNECSDPTCHRSLNSCAAPTTGQVASTRDQLQATCSISTKCESCSNMVGCTWVRTVHNANYCSTLCPKASAMCSTDSRTCRDDDAKFAVANVPCASISTCSECTDHSCAWSLGWPESESRCVDACNGRPSCATVSNQCRSDPAVCAKHVRCGDCTLQGCLWTSRGCSASCPPGHSYCFSDFLQCPVSANVPGYGETALTSLVDSSSSLHSACQTNRNCISCSARGCVWSLGPTAPAGICQPECSAGSTSCHHTTLQCAAFGAVSNTASCPAQQECGECLDAGCTWNIFEGVGSCARACGLGSDCPPRPQCPARTCQEIKSCGECATNPACTWNIDSKLSRQYCGDTCHVASTGGTCGTCSVPTLQQPTAVVPVGGVSSMRCSSLPPQCDLCLQYPECLWSSQQKSCVNVCRDNDSCYRDPLRCVADEAPPVVAPPVGAPCYQQTNCKTCVLASGCLWSNGKCDSKCANDPLCAFRLDQCDTYALVKPTLGCQPHTDCRQCALAGCVWTKEGTTTGVCADSCQGLECVDTMKMCPAPLRQQCAQWLSCGQCAGAGCVWDGERCGVACNGNRCVVEPFQCGVSLDAPRVTCRSDSNCPPMQYCSTGTTGQFYCQYWGQVGDVCYGGDRRCGANLMCDEATHRCVADVCAQISDCAQCTSSSQCVFTAGRCASSCEGDAECFAKPEHCVDPNFACARWKGCESCTQRGCEWSADFCRAQCTPGSPFCAVRTEQCPFVPPSPLLNPGWCVQANSCSDCVQAGCAWEGASGCQIECKSGAGCEMTTQQCQARAQCPQCDREYLPVCAGGKTFTNQCVARCNNYKAFRNGQCCSADAECHPGAVCRGGVCEGGWLSAPASRQCLRLEDCSIEEYCDGNTGTCVPRQRTVTYRSKQTPRKRRKKKLANRKKQANQTKTEN